MNKLATGLSVLTVASGIGSVAYFTGESTLQNIEEKVWLYIDKNQQWRADMEQAYSDVVGKANITINRLNSEFNILKEGYDEKSLYVLQLEDENLSLNHRIYELGTEKQGLESQIQALEEYIAELEQQIANNNSSANLLEQANDQVNYANEEVQKTYEYIDSNITIDEDSMKTVTEIVEENQLVNP